MKKSKIFAVLAAAAMAVSALAIPASAESYNAYLGVQEPTNWSFRNAWNDKDLGKGTEYFDHVTANYPAAPENKGGTFTDVEITGDGTYTVSLTGDFDFGGSEAFSLLFVSTDLPIDCGATISDVKVKIDGNTKHTFKEAFLNPDEKEYLSVLCINQWNGDIEQFGYVMPSSSVEIEFTVSGLGDGAAAPAAEETAAPAADADTTSTATGNTAAGVILSVMALAGAAAVISKRK